MEYILEIKGLTKHFGKIRAVDNLNLVVKKGSVFGLLGPNGSGKSTSLGMILGVVNPKSGSYSWFGIPPDHHVRKRIGAIIEGPGFYPNLSAEQNLRIVATIKDVDNARIDPVLERVGLLSRKTDPFQSFSLGMKQRLAIASALLCDPEVMILDEPTNGLDPQGIADIRALIIGLAAEGRTIILASHLLDEVQKICTEFAVLSHGKMVYQGSVSELLKAGSKLRLSSADEPALKSYLERSDLIVSHRKQDAVHSVVLKEGIDVTTFHRDLLAHGIVLDLLQHVEGSLEQKFLEILQSNANA
jgi:ABC-2 type transport system ATP-binding protein